MINMTGIGGRVVFFSNMYIENKRYISKHILFILNNFQFCKESKFSKKN